jgi:uncharacterized protein YyaL (SSP411 family)
MPTVLRSLDWAEWNEAAFAHAGRENIPVFLYLHAVWSAPCRHLEQNILADPSLAGFVGEHFVPIRVDVDVRPDIADRYGLGSWPSVLVLTPEGDILTGGQALDPSRLVGALSRVFAVFRTRRAELRAVAQSAGAPWTQATRSEEPIDRDAPASFLRSMAEQVDRSSDRQGGDEWLHPVTLEALVQISSRVVDPDARTLVNVLIDQFVAALHDTGGHDVVHAFRMPIPMAPEGSVALLAPNASGLALLSEAASVLGRADLREPAMRLASFIADTLRHPGGGFVHGRRDAGMDASGDMSEDEDSSRTRPDAVDRRRFVDGNAAAAQAFLRAARVFDEPFCGEQAGRAIDHVLNATYERQRGLAHLLDPEPRLRGLLGDQVTAASAFLEAFDASGMRVYLDLAEELMRGVLRVYGQAQWGALQDRASTADTPSIGLLNHPFFPFSLNCLAARVLVRLSSRTQDVDFVARARDVLSACCSLPPATPVDEAHYALAVLELADA